MHLLVNQQHPLSASDNRGEIDIAVLEQNTNINQIIYNIDQKNTSDWMFQFLGITQTYVFVSHEASAKTFAWEILINPFREDPDEQILVIALNDIQQ